MFDRTVFNGFWGWDTRPYDAQDRDEAVFFGDDMMKEKLDLFFQYFNGLPQWYQWLLIGIFGAIYGLKPAAGMFGKK